MGTQNHSNLNAFNNTVDEEMLDNYENEAFFDQNQQIENNQHNFNVYDVEEDLYDMHDNEITNNYLQNEFEQANEQEMDTDMAGEPTYTQQDISSPDYIEQQHAEQLQCNELSLSLQDQNIASQSELDIRSTNMSSHQTTGRAPITRPRRSAETNKILDWYVDIWSVNK